jgi:hypothetical protein
VEEAQITFLTVSTIRKGEEDGGGGVAGGVFNTAGAGVQIKAGISAIGACKCRRRSDGHFCWSKSLLDAPTRRNCAGVWVQFVAFGFFFFVILNSSLRANHFGQCGSECCDEIETPVRLSVPKVAQICAANLYSIVVDVFGRAFSCGWLGYGQDGGEATLKQPSFRSIGKEILIYIFCYFV